MLVNADKVFDVLRTYKKERSFLNKKKEKKPKVEIK